MTQRLLRSVFVLCALLSPEKCVPQSGCNNVQCAALSIHLSIYEDGYGDRVL